MNTGSQERCSADVHKKVSTRSVGDLSKPSRQREHLEMPLRFPLLCSRLGKHANKYWREREKPSRGTDPGFQLGSRLLQPLLPDAGQERGRAGFILGTVR